MGWGAAKGSTYSPPSEDLRERVTAIQQRLPDALGKVMGELSSTHGFAMQNDVIARAQEIVQTIFKNNPDRVSHDLKRYDVGRASDGDIALVIATLFGHLMVADAAYEGRKEITMSDVYLALADFEKAQGWH